MQPLKITVLGAGDAFGSEGRFQAGYVIQSNGLTVLMDAGPTLLPALKRNGIAPADIDLVLISHLHGDHFGGLGFLILEYLYESPRSRALTIAGPPRLEERTAALFRAIYHETDFTPVWRKLNFVPLRPNQTTRLKGIKVSSIRTPHTTKDVSLGFRLSIDGKTIAFSGDTGWTEELIPLAAGADLFLCECTYFSNPLEIHLNYPLIVANRERFSARRMILTHLGREVLEHKSEIKFETAYDGMKIEI